MTEVPRARISEPKLLKKLVKFQAENEQFVELEAVYEDSITSGSPFGTVVAFHGSPGSHNDFKYIRSKLDDLNIRFIGVNYPGFSNTPEYEGQQHANPERQNFSNALLDELKIDGKIIYMGHSRGCENALQTAVGREAHGLVLINPTGFRHHQGIRPFYRLEYLDWMYGLLPSFLGNSMILGIYKAIGFKVKSGEEAMCAMRSVMRMSLEDQIEYIEKLNQKHTKKLIVFGGNDHLVEEEIVLEKLEKHDGLEHFRFEDGISEEEKSKIMECFTGNQLGASVFVAKDTHFQNKSQAELVAESCKKMLDA
ncbi:AB hydrolase-1 domain-containing protein [Caenorhabditis elegans]|uniref:AB hydrolase-1 domain-containing protein n=1 Tax=Caenorhabditis elegans TaxID=6239 RepID=Q9N4E1_CAEEL|nr:AB hydrolase-1 domain-containing protein [Caenorhabditis elegans]CCD66871.1 AB hydrolase-1 domain-containing protein [Caenorhabditis elegans]|eukprot:NP_503879.1 Uncharacterized protein CELE_Y73C8B.2 [Caenorhabditis elegans]